MTLTTQVYLRNAEGELKQYEAAEVDSFDHAIRLVRQETGVHRVLCVVPAHKEAAA